MHEPIHKVKCLNAAKKRWPFLPFRPHARKNGRGTLERFFATEFVFGRRIRDNEDSCRCPTMRAEMRCQRSGVILESRQSLAHY
jgi:hypothetical protein